MISRMSLVGVIALVLAASAPAAAADDTASPARCDIRGYLADPDPAGTNVRAAPSAGAAILTRLPFKQAGDEKLFPEIVITGFSHGWAEIGEAAFADYGTGSERVLFKGRGWISGKLISATLNRPVLRSRPDGNAPVIERLIGADWGPDSVTVLAIEDCLGPFAKVTARMPGGRVVHGWADGLCSNQVTTCP